MGKALGLTQTGVQSSPGNIQYYDSPQATVDAFDKGNVAPEQIASAPKQIPMLDSSGNEQEQSGPGLSFIPENQPKAASFQKPNFLQASQDPSQKGLTKAGTLVNILLGGLSGAAAGAGSWTVGEGFARATGMAQRKQQIIGQQKQQEIENQRQQQEEKRRQQEADQQNANYKSESELRAQQIEESKAKVGAKDRNPKEVYDDDIKNGLTPAQALEHAYNIKAPVVSERNPTEDSLAYTAENDADPDKRKAASAALERITKNKIRVSAAGRAASEGDKEDKRRFDADVTGYYGHVISQGGNTSGAENILKERLKDPKLTPYQKQVASETLRRVRQEQQSALR